MAISRWEKEVTPVTLRENLRNPPPFIPHTTEDTPQQPDGRIA